MNPSVSVMPSNSPPDQSTPIILDSLPDPPISGNGCPRDTRLKIDLILLAIESLELGASEAMLALTNDLGLQGIIKNRVIFWRLRSTNPLRRAHSRRPLKLVEAKALVVIISHLARRLTVTIRQLLYTAQQLRDKEIPLDNDFRLSEYLERFRAHFRSRMNPRRSLIAAYNSDDKLNHLAIGLLGQLLFCTGTLGMNLFCNILFDGEV